MVFGGTSQYHGWEGEGGFHNFHATVNNTPYHKTLREKSSSFYLVFFCAYVVQKVKMHK